MSSIRFGRLRNLELTFLFQELSEESADALQTVFHHVAPTLQVLSLDVFCYTSGELTQRQRWVERWTAPLAALRRVKLLEYERGA